MDEKIIPKKENENKGYHYSVTDEQIAAYSKWTLYEKMRWIEETNKFIYSVQTPAERELRRNIGNMEI